MDVLFINSFDFSNKIEPYIGQLILRDILKNKYTVDCINFDLLNKIGEITYSNDINYNIELISQYILNKKPKIVGFYTICNSFIYTIQIAKYLKDKDKSLIIIFGGPHASTTAKE